MRFICPAKVIELDGVPKLQYDQRCFKAGLKSFVGKDIQIILQVGRSLEQNAKIHAICQEMAIRTGESLEACKNYLKYKFLGEEVLEINGEKITQLKSTSSLSKEESILFIQQCEAFINQI